MARVTLDSVRLRLMSHHLLTYGALKVPAIRRMVCRCNSEKDRCQIVGYLHEKISFLCDGSIIC